MDNQIEISFRSDKEHVQAWEAALKLLVQDGTAGMEFQDHMLKHFGKSVDEKLEEFLEEWGTEVFYVEGWDQENSQFSFEIPAIDDWDAQIDQLRSLFSLCPISGLKIELFGEE
ncbi:hypothetical protein CF392_14335 [Tamilnaduibacter salinus]|uniref:Uncharacterized protein n=1 Tax=Tamilnaduibacter salinus TaxID=1484056 RepID=A0A2A2I043_9GAMM|nr:hypothetical protein [Tamilnaduibacter salinus]PAV24778.1 hypothetical protein CF392_14335 [Tamilnaduibacter salinus]